MSDLKETFAGEIIHAATTAGQPAICALVDSKETLSLPELLGCIDELRGDIKIRSLAEAALLNELFHRAPKDEKKRLQRMKEILNRVNEERVAMGLEPKYKSAYFSLEKVSAWEPFREAKRRGVIKNNSEAFSLFPSLGIRHLAICGEVGSRNNWELFDKIWAFLKLLNDELIPQGRGRNAEDVRILLHRYLGGAALPRPKPLDPDSPEGQQVAKWYFDLIGQWMDAALIELDLKKARKAWYILHRRALRVHRSLSLSQEIVESPK